MFMQKHSDLSIVIVTFNSEKFIVNCLDNIKADESLSRTKIFVIDNNSTDRTADLLRNYHKDLDVTYNKRNIGYGSACNQGIKKCDTPFALFMNPDAFPQKGVIANLLAHMENDPMVGAASCKLVNPDNTIQYSCREFPRPSFVLMRAMEKYSIRAKAALDHGYLMADHDHDTNKNVPWLTGAFMMVRRDCFDQIGGFDEGYFLYCEDADLCLRLNIAGWRVDYAAQSGNAVHFHQRKSRQHRVSRETFIHASSLIRFFFKNSRYINSDRSIAFRPELIYSRPSPQDA